MYVDYRYQIYLIWNGTPLPPGVQMVTVHICERRALGICAWHLYLCCPSAWLTNSPHKLFHVVSRVRPIINYELLWFLWTHFTSLYFPINYYYIISLLSSNSCSVPWSTVSGLLLHLGVNLATAFGISDIFQTKSISSWKSRGWTYCTCTVIEMCY